MTTSQLIRDALAEDIGAGDATSRLTVPADATARARLVARAGGVLAGIGVCRDVFLAVDPRTRFRALRSDGSRFRPGALLARVSGRARSLLAAERTALNFLQHLAGVATLTSRFCAAARGTKAAILDTRKTTPGLRALEKYAVRCGGGTNHRSGLYDQILVKDNHIKAAGSVTAALARCRTARLPVEVEARTIAEVGEALAAGCPRILLDNMTPAQLRQAVRLVRGQARLEASGGVTLRNVGAVARTGVDCISVGALTHSAPAVDIALDFLHE
jgi:nicotinate-nucleotide pyrophosphorylase (carboxylating)